MMGEIQFILKNTYRVLRTVLCTVWDKIIREHTSSGEKSYKKNHIMKMLKENKVLGVQ